MHNAGKCTPVRTPGIRAVPRRIAQNAEMQGENRECPARSSPTRRPGRGTRAIMGGAGPGETSTATLPVD